MYIKQEIKGGKTDLQKQCIAYTKGFVDFYVPHWLTFIDGKYKTLARTKRK